MSRTPNEVSLSMPAIRFDVAVYGIIYGNISRVTVESWQWYAHCVSSNIQSLNVMELHRTLGNKFESYLLATFSMLDQTFHSINSSTVILFLSTPSMCFSLVKFSTCLVRIREKSLPTLTEDCLCVAKSSIIMLISYKTTEMPSIHTYSIQYLPHQKKTSNHQWLIEL